MSVLQFAFAGSSRSISSIDMILLANKAVEQNAPLGCRFTFLGFIVFLSGLRERRCQRVAHLDRSVKTMRTIALLLLAIMCSCSAKDEAEEALNAARRLAAEGKYEQALEKQVWFHNHALETRPSYYGVRLSYALSDWIELGKKYPAALAKLKGIRDEKTLRLLAGEKDREIFHDVVSINDQLVLLCHISKTKKLSVIHLYELRFNTLPRNHRCMFKPYLAFRYLH